MAQDELEVRDEQPEAASGEQQANSTWIIYPEYDATPDNIEYAGDESDAGDEID